MKELARARWRSQVINDKTLLENIKNREAMYSTGIAMAGYFIYEAAKKIYEMKHKPKEDLQ